MCPDPQRAIEKLEHNVLKHNTVGKPKGILFNIYNFKKSKMDDKEAGAASPVKCYLFRPSFQT